MRIAMLSAALTLTAAVGAAQTPAGYGPNPKLPPGSASRSSPTGCKIPGGSTCRRAAT